MCELDDNHGCDQFLCGVGENKASGDSRSEQGGYAREDHRQDALARRAQSRPNANISGAKFHLVAYEAVYADQGERQGQRGEDGEEPALHALKDQRPRNDLGHGLRRFGRHSRIDCVDSAVQRRNNRFGSPSVRIASFMLPRSLGRSASGNESIRISSSARGSL